MDFIRYSRFVWPLFGELNTRGGGAAAGAMRRCKKQALQARTDRPFF